MSRIEFPVQPEWTVGCPKCNAAPEKECCSIVSGCVLDYGHYERAIAQRKKDKLHATN